MLNGSKFKGISYTSSKWVERQLRQTEASTEHPAWELLGSLGAVVGQKVWQRKLGPWKPRRSLEGDQLSQEAASERDAQRRGGIHTFPDARFHSRSQLRSWRWPSERSRKPSLLKLHERWQRILSVDCTTVILRSSEGTGSQERALTPGQLACGSDSPATKRTWTRKTIQEETMKHCY